MNPNELFGFAEEQLKKSLQEILKKAFDEGYNKGYKDGQKVNVVTKKSDEKGLEWIDFELPNGMLWAFAGVGVYPTEQEQLLPTEDDYKMLEKYCQSKRQGSKVEIVGPTGRVLTISTIGNYKDVKYSNFVWIKSNMNDYMNRSSFRLSVNVTGAWLDTFNIESRYSDNPETLILLCKHK
ncbi:MAG: hypothetical protein Q4D14_06370 [Bacteroidales bacterium]|nr:hypothetical protein [Bacteroidales bacterium]